MAEQNEQGAQASKRRMPLMTFLILAAVLVVEVAAAGVAYWVVGGPSQAQASGAAADSAADLEKPVEMVVVEDKFQNTRTGRAYLYDTEIYIVVRKKHEKEVGQRLESMRAQISTEIATIIRRAEPSHLLEPELSTLTRQVRAVLSERLGRDADGEPYLEEVLIRKCMQFRSDY